MLSAYGAKWAQSGAAWTAKDDDAIQAFLDSQVAAADAVKAFLDAHLRQPSFER